MPRESLVVLTIVAKIEKGNCALKLIGHSKACCRDSIDHPSAPIERAETGAYGSHVSDLSTHLFFEHRVAMFRIRIRGHCLIDETIEFLVEFSQQS